MTVQADSEVVSCTYEQVAARCSFDCQWEYSFAFLRRFTVRRYLGTTGSGSAKTLVGLPATGSIWSRTLTLVNSPRTPTIAKHPLRTIVHNLQYVQL